MWKKYCTARQVTDDIVTRRMSIACWIPKATNSHPNYAMLIAFPVQTMAARTRINYVYTHTACPVAFIIIITAA